MSNPSPNHTYDRNDWFPQAGKKFDIAVLIIVWMLFGVLIYTTPLVSWWMLGLILFLAFEANDLVVGIVHWGLDKYIRYDHKVFGHLARTFREHHPRPEEIYSHGYLETNSNAYFFVMLLTIPTISLVHTPGARWFCLFFLIIGAQSATIHRWAHVPQAPRVVSLLQRWGVLLSPGHHINHHNGYMSHYCAISGHLNPFFDGLKIWRGIEYVIKKATKIAPFHELERSEREKMGGAMN